LHVVELLADLRQTRLQLIHRVVQRLDLRGELIDLAAVVCGQTLHLVLQVVDRSIHLVDAVGALLDEVFHHPHVHVDGLLQARHLVLQRLNLRLQLHHFFVRGKAGNSCRQHDGRDGEPKYGITNLHIVCPQENSGRVSRRDHGTPRVAPSGREAQGRRQPISPPPIVLSLDY
jgi:hypothetical protein